MKRLLLSAAVIPLLHAGVSQAETKISNAVTTPLSTSTAANGAADDLTIESGGSVKPTAPGAAVTIDSSDVLRNSGTIGFNDVNDATGVLALGGFSAGVVNSNIISVVEDYTATDTDNDGDLDGAFARGSNRFGVRLTGAQPFFGDITHNRGAQILLEGNDSGGIVLNAPLAGSLNVGGTVSVTGDRIVGVSAHQVSGDARITGAVSVLGEAATGVALTNVDGAVLIQNAITATGYRYTDRLADDARGKLDADDLKQGGSALTITGNVGRGVFLERAPTDADSSKDDEDGDGVKDAEESTAALSVYGSAPALAIGGEGATFIGRVGDGDYGFGLVNRGSITARGVNDGVSATAVRIGRDPGATTTVEGGFHNFGAGVQATAYGANATGVHISAGAVAPELRNAGSITSGTTSESAHRADGVLIDVGSRVEVFRNSGVIAVEVLGERGDATAVTDRAGSITFFENTGAIRAAVTATDDSKDADDSDTNPDNETVTGRAIALDLRANTSGVTFRQVGRADGDDNADGTADPDDDSDGVDNADEPVMSGEMLLGSGGDRVELLNGFVFGAIDFGGGADSLVIDGASARLRLVDADESLGVDLRKGALDLDQTGDVRIGSLNIGSDGALNLTVDAGANAATRLSVAGSAVLADGAEIGVKLNSLLREARSYEVIRAGRLDVGQVESGLIGSPYLYVASLRADETAGTVTVDVRRRTAAEMNLNRSETQAFDAVFDSLDRDDDIETAFLAETDAEGLVRLYDQMLPDHSGGALMSASAISAAISSAINERADPRTADGPTRLWAQQIWFDLEQERDQALGYRSRGFGLAGGVEEALSDDSAYGLSMSFVSARYNDRGAAAGERIGMTFGEVGAYGRTTLGGLRLDARAGVGLVGFESDRRFVSPVQTINLQTSAEWTGWLADAHFGAAYELATGPVYARPELSLDYLHLSEDGYEEEGGGDGLDLAIDSRSGDLLTGSAALALGARFGDDVKWGPEVKVGWRQRLAGDAGQTTARFLSGGDPFTLDPEQPYEGGLTARLALKASGTGAAFSLEGGAELQDRYTQYDVRAVLKVSF
jgi:hypothetical protein